MSDDPTPVAPSSEPPAGGAARTGSKQPIDLPITRAMPRPLLAVFVLLGLTALGVTGALLIKPTTLQTVPLEERRPAPANGFSHDPVKVNPVPPPATIPTLPPACDALAGTRWVMSGDGALRLHEALRSVCSLVGPGTDAATLQAIEGLGRATVRFAQFDRTGIESTLDHEAGIIWLNFRFADRVNAPRELIPILLHEGFHLAASDPAPTAERELIAREVEATACREFIPRDTWQRWCTDAETLSRLPRADATALLQGAGFA